MKWGRRKKTTSLPPCPRTPSLLSSWILKFKKMGGSNEKEKYVKGVSKRKPCSRSPSRMMGYSHGSGNNGVKNGHHLHGRRCVGYDGYDGGDDVGAFWRISFKEEHKSISGVPGQSVLRPVWYDSDEEPGAPPSSCRSCNFGVEEGEGVHKFDEMVSDAKRRKEKAIPNRVRGYESNQQVLLEIEKDLSKLELEERVGIEEKRISTMNCNPRKDVCFVDMDYGSNASKLRGDPLFSPTKLRKPKDCTLKNYEKQRKSHYISRELPKRRLSLNQSNRVRAYSPRTATRIETCKLRALEDIKRAKLKMKRKIKEKNVPVEGKNVLEEFAVVKCSFDPPRDFRESMMEMIMERGISRPDELEELLACYLTLNSDVYHDLIIKVFRQVWFELNHARFGNESAELLK